MADLKYILITLAIIFNIGVNAQKVWDLQDCIQYAYDNNIQIKQAEIDSRIAESRLKQSKYELFPDLNFSGTERLSYGNTVIPITNELVVTEVRSSGFSANSQMDLFRGFQNIHTMRKNSLDFLASKYDIDKIKNDISLSVTNAYLLILFNQEIAITAEQQVGVTRKQTERVEKLVNSGTLPKGNALELQAQLADEERQLVDANNQIILANLNLLQLLQLEAATGMEIRKPYLDNIDLKMEELSPAQIYEKSLTIMPEIKSAQLKLESSSKNLSISRASRSPYLSLGGSFGSGYSGYQPTPYFQQITNNIYRNIGISLSIPIFTKYNIQHSVNQAKLMEERANYSLIIQKNELRQNVEKAHVDASTAMKSFEANSKSVIALQESFKYAEKRFEGGLINAVDYNINKNNLRRAESQLLRSKYDYIFKRKILDFFLGRAIVL